MCLICDSYLACIHIYHGLIRAYHVLSPLYLDIAGQFQYLCLLVIDKLIALPLGAVIIETNIIGDCRYVVKQVGSGIIAGYTDDIAVICSKSHPGKEEKTYDEQDKSHGYNYTKKGDTGGDLSNKNKRDTACRVSTEQTNYRYGLGVVSVDGGNIGNILA